MKKVYNKSKRASYKGSIPGMRAGGSLAKAQSNVAAGDNVGTDPTGGADATVSPRGWPYSDQWSSGDMFAEFSNDLSNPRKGFKDRLMDEGIISALSGTGPARYLHTVGSMYGDEFANMFNRRGGSFKKGGTTKGTVLGGKYKKGGSVKGRNGVL